MYVQLFIFSKILYNIRIPGFSESLVRHPGKFNFLDMCISLIREFRSADLFRRFIRSIRRQYMSFVLAYNHSVIFHITTIYLSTRICSIISQCIVQHNTESNFFILNHIIRNRYIKTQHMFGSCFTYHSNQTMHDQYMGHLLPTSSSVLSLPTDKFFLFPHQPHNLS